MDTKEKIAAIQAKLEEVARLMGEVTDEATFSTTLQRAHCGLIETTEAMSEFAFEYSCERVMRMEGESATAFGRRAHEHLEKAFRHLADAAEVQKR